MNRIEYPEGDKTVCLAIREISDRKHAEKNLRISEEKFSKAFRAGPDAIVISTLDDGRILDVNYNFIRMTGFARGESVGRTSLDLGIWLNPKERDQMVAVVKRDGEVRDLELRLSVKSGEVRNFLMSAHTIELEGTMCLISILRDVTERKALEEQLRQAQKMEAVGRLAGGVAHDFNNLLVGILGYSELLKKKVPPGDLQRMTEEINSAAIRARDLTSRLLALSRRQVLQPRVLDFNALVRQTESLLRPVIGEDIQVEMRLDPSSGSVKADPAQLEQVVLNLALNARDAMPNGGTLAMETCNIEVSAAFARQHPGLDSRKVRSAARGGYGARDESGGDGEDFRAVLHDQAGRSGRRAWTFDRVRNCEAERWVRHGGKRTRKRRGFWNLFAACARDSGETNRGAGGYGVADGARNCAARGR